MLSASQIGIGALVSTGVAGIGALVAGTAVSMFSGRAAGLVSGGLGLLVVPGVAFYVASKAVGTA